MIVRANELVKENGIEKFKRILDDLTEQGHAGGFYEELKRLVESHEIVMSWGGLSDARAVSKMGKYYKYLKKAIADVESCNE